jgi:hypothetical protein
MTGKYLFIILFFTIISHSIYASEQYPDLIIYNGKEYEIGNYPMETYFEIYPNRRPKSIGKNSALLRGYRAKYEIINNELVLIEIQTKKLNGNWKIVNNRYFRNKPKINTFSGRINIFSGETTGVFMAFTPIYESYIILEIKDGNFIREYEENCYEYLKSIIQSFPNGSHEQNYFIGLLEKLNKKNN